MQNKLILFDIDLTLIRTGGAGLRAMGRALREFTGYEGDFVSVRPDGKTDPNIVPELFAANDIPYDRADYETFMQMYLGELDKERQNPVDWDLLPGVVPLLEAVSSDPQLYMALVTGNDERGARLKLGAFDLNPYFPIGAFASDSAVRSELIVLATRRAEKHYGLSFSKNQVIVIGDSIGDVKAAKENGVACLAVTTGLTSAEELENAGPCTIIPDLTNRDQVLGLLRK